MKDNHKKQISDSAVPHRVVPGIYLNLISPQSDARSVPDALTPRRDGNLKTIRVVWS